MQLTQLFRTAALAFTLAAGPAWAEVCEDAGATELVRSIRYCASSVLADQGQTSYRPRNLQTDNGVWCEGAVGDGVGESVTIRFGEPVRFRRVSVTNGHIRTSTSFPANGRARAVEITTSDGVRLRTTLEDSAEPQTLVLPRIARARWLRLTLRSVTRGERDNDTCLSFFGPDLEELGR
jgi:hypothetical protein